MRRRRTGRGEVTPIRDLFAVYKARLRAPQQSVVNEVVAVVREVTSIQLEAKQCRYTVHSRTVAITAPGPVKTEIKLQEDRIIALLKARLGEQSAPKVFI